MAGSSQLAAEELHASKCWMGRRQLAPLSGPGLWVSRHNARRTHPFLLLVLPRAPGTSKACFDKEPCTGRDSRALIFGVFYRMAFSSRKEACPGLSMTARATEFLWRVGGWVGGWVGRGCGLAQTGVQACW